MVVATSPPRVHPTAAHFAERAEAELGFEPAIEEFPEGTETAADAAAAVGCDVGAIVKSVVLVVDGDPVVVLTAGDRRVDEAALAAALGADGARPADAGEVKRATGWSIGGVPPFLHETAAPVYLDPSLLDRETVWAAAGTPEAVFPIAPADLIRLVDPETVEAFVEA